MTVNELTESVRECMLGEECKECYYAKDENRKENCKALLCMDVVMTLQSVELANTLIKMEKEIRKSIKDEGALR